MNKSIILLFLGLCFSFLSQAQKPATIECRIGPKVGQEIFLYRVENGQSHYDKAPAFGYYASQKTYYYGYKLYAVCNLNGVIHLFDLTKANVHDIHYLQDIKQEYNNCTLPGRLGIS